MTLSRPDIWFSPLRKSFPSFRFHFSPSHHPIFLTTTHSTPLAKVHTLPTWRIRLSPFSIPISTVHSPQLIHHRPISHNYQNPPQFQFPRNIYIYIYKKRRKQNKVPGNLEIERRQHFLQPLPASLFLLIISTRQEAKTKANSQTWRSHLLLLSLGKEF